MSLNVFLCHLPRNDGIIRLSITRARLLRVSNVIDTIFGCERLLCFCFVSLSLIDCRYCLQYVVNCLIKSQPFRLPWPRRDNSSVGWRVHCVACKCVGGWKTIKLPFAYLWITFNHWTRQVIDFETFAETILTAPIVIWCFRESHRKLKDCRASYGFNLPPTCNVSRIRCCFSNQHVFSA